MISYSTNWMGPISIRWYEERGLTKKVEYVMETDTALHKAGDVVIRTEILEDYAGGRIDVYGTDNPWGDEIGLAVMRAEDWGRLSDFLSTLTTETMWTLGEILTEFYKTNPKIVWAKDVFPEK